MSDSTESQASVYDPLAPVGLSDSPKDIVALPASDAPETPWNPIAELVSALLKRVSRLEARVGVLEAVATTGDPAPRPSAPVVANQVVPPTALVPKKSVEYDPCPSCGQVHDGTGRYMDTRGKLIPKDKLKRCSQSWL